MSPGRLLVDNPSGGRLDTLYFSTRIQMTSKKSKQNRLKESRMQRAKALAGIDTRDENITPPAGAIIADHSQLMRNNTYDRFPRFYVDKIVICKDCGKEEVWTAENQKWWYEEAKGNINTTAIRCRSCRDKEKARKDKARQIHLEGLAKKQI